tara:strand:+ start:4301 stop:5788 length:1488 start_codon:yes stop_codon:yes gene_type:complete
VCLSFSSKAVDCDTDTVGLCTPTIEQIIEEVITETIEFKPDGILTTTTTDTTTTTTTVSNEDSGDILDGDNGYVTSSKEGDMDIDWGGQGSASMPSGSGCYNLGTDKCAQITGSGNSTSVMGVENMGTTFINTVDVSDLNIKYGGKTNYSIKVDKQDASDSIYMHITGKNGNTSVFSGTDILSASGTNSGFDTYTGGFDFSGSITSVIIEVGGRDINLAIGPLFDDVSINILYNTINTIIEQTITTVEMFVALNPDVPDEVIDVVEDIFDANTPIETDAGFEFEPIEVEEVSYDSVEIEIAEIEIEEIQVASVDVSENVEVSVADVESEIEMELEMDIEDVETDTTEAEPTEESPTESENAEPNEDKTEEPKQESKQEETEVAEAKEETNQEESQDDEKQESSKEKAAKKVMKKIDDKKRYDANSQLKTLVVMQVLGNTKSFFNSQQELNDRANFFTNLTLPDAVISDNNIAGYLLFGGSNQLMNEMIDSQWQQK